MYEYKNPYILVVPQIVRTEKSTHVGAFFLSVYPSSVQKQIRGVFNPENSTRFAVKKTFLGDTISSRRTSMIE